MQPHAVRLAPWPHRAALLLLVPLALLASVLLGLLAQSATAGHDDSPPPPPQLVGPATPGADTTPTWTFTTPLDTSTTSEPTVINGATTTVTIAHEYDTQCVYGTSAVGEGGFSATTPSCTSPYDGATSGDGTYVLSARTAETTTTTTTTDDGTGPKSGGPVVETSYSGVGSAGYLLDTTKPDVTVTGPTGAVYTGWTVALVDATGSPVTYGCRVTDTTTGVVGSSFTCNTGTVMPELTASGTYTLTVVATDGAKNSTSVTSQPFAHDADTPTVQLTRETSSPNSAQQPVWAYSVSEGIPTCVLVGPSGSAVSGGSCSVDRYTAPTLTASGTYTLTVSTADAAGNVGSASSSYVLDLLPPTISITPGSSTGSSSSVEWLIDISGAASAGCSVRGADTSTGSCGATGGTVTAERAADGTISLTVRATDAYGNAAEQTVTYTVDRTAGLTVGTAPPSPGKDTTPTWEFTVEQGATVTCSLSGPAPATSHACSTTGFTAGELPATSGTDYVLKVTVQDGLGNLTTYTLPTYRLDTVAVLTPGTPPTPTPETADDDRTPTWAFASESNARSITCVMTSSKDGTFYNGPCTTANSFTAPTLPDTAGTVWTLKVTVVDALGNTSTTTLPTYLLDTLATLTVVDPVSPGNDTTPSWTFTAESGASVTCALDGPGVPATGATCTAGGYTAGTLPGTPGADYVLTVTVTDALGNVTVYTRPAHHLDTQLPSATITVPSGPSREVTVTWGVAVDEALTSATCALRRDGAVVMSLANCPGSSAVQLPGDGRYDLVVTLVDRAGNRSTTTSTVLVHDATIPPAPVVSPTSLTSHRTTTSWTITAEAGIATTCRLTRGSVLISDWTACSGTYGYAFPADGSYLLEVVSTDSVGPGPVTSVSYVLDTVAPVAPTASGPTGPSQSRSPSWTLSTESGTTAECRLVRGGTVVKEWAACSAGLAADLTALPDGAYVLESRATDAAGNVSPAGASAPYVLDTTAPVAPVVTGPSGPSQARTPGFTWTGESEARSECQLTRDGVVVGGWVACTSGYAPTLSTDGTWTLAVRLTDAAGNVSDAASSGGYVLDTTPPQTPVVTPPGTPGRDLAPSWGAVVEGGSTLECRLTRADGTVGAWAACTMPHVTGLEGRPDGAYVLEVRSTDAAGNVSAIGSGTYVLDTSAPAAAVVVSPASPGRTRTPSFTFTTEEGARTTCRLTSGATLLSDFAACTSPTGIDLTDLPDGTYTLTVRVTDAAGNPGPAATGTYVLDTTGPAAPVFTLIPATPSPSRSIAFAFSYEPGSTLVCRLTFPTGAVREISACSSPLSVDLTGLPDGSYTLSVRAVDAAGNVGPAATSVHGIDSAALAAPEISGPVTPGTDRTPTWLLTVPVGTSECRLVRGTTVVRDWAACSASYTADLFGQPDGTYTLQARATVAGVVSATTSSRYVLDTTPPAAATLVAPPTPSTNRRPTWSIASPEEGATAMCRVLVFDSVLRDWATCVVSMAGALHPVDLTGLGDGTYTLEVRLTDAAGNVGTSTATSSYVLDTKAPVAVGVTGPPSPGNDPSPTWLLSTSGGTELECRLSSAAGVVADWAPCAGEYTADLTDSPDGTYTLAVRAVSAAGTPGPETTSAYVFSTTGPTAPTAVALSGVKSPSNDRSPTWTFTLPTGTTGHCKVVQGTRVVFDGACSSPFTLDLSSAADGTYTLTVAAVDAAGNRTAAAPSSYVLDTEPTEQPVFTQVPGATGSTLDPRWRFTVVRGATAQCRLLHQGSALDDWASCTSPYTAVLAGRPDGEYVLQVRAVDVAGNTSAPVADRYLLDRTAPPVVTFTATPVTPDDATSVSWTVAAPEGSTLECRLVAPDGVTAWSACGSLSGGALRTTGSSAPTSATVRLDLRGRPDGDYVLEVRVVQSDGTVGAVSRATYRLDTTAPDAPAFSDTPPTAGNSPTPAWLWAADGDVLVECRLVRVGGAAVTGWAECPDGQYVADLSRLGQGSYALEIRLTDAAGNLSPVTSAAYRYDTSAPAAPVFTSRPPASGSDRTVSWTFSVPADATATCTVTRDFGVIRSATACSGRYDLNLSGLPDGSYTLTVRYTDSAGNVGPSSSSSYGLATLRAGGPVRVDPTPAPPPEPAPVGGGTAPIPGPGRTGTGAGPRAPAPGGSTSAPAVPTIPTDDDVVRSSDSRAGGVAFLPAATDRQDAAPPAPQPKPSGSNNLLLPEDFVDSPVPDVIRDVAIGTIKRPTLPLALLAIVVLFLLAQNRIDRRDPKLAAAPVEAEPELDFIAYVGRPEGIRT